MTADPAARWRARPGWGRRRKPRRWPWPRPLFPVGGDRSWFDDLADASLRAAEVKHGPRWATIVGADGREYAVPSSPDRARADRRAALDEIARTNAREGLYDGDDF